MPESFVVDEPKLRRFWLPDLAGFMCYAILAALVLVVQVGSGAYRSDFSLDSDEPAHAVSSLMVHDYFAHPSPLNALAFGQRFYGHYPKVAIGHWPPMFYVCEGVWALIFGRNRTALLSFVALCGVLLTWSVYFELRSRLPVAFAFFASLLLLFSAPFESMISSVRPDLLLSLAVFWAAVLAGRAMFSSRRKDLFLFVALAVFACLVHGRGALLLIVPFLLLPATKRHVSWKWVVAGVLVFCMFLVPPYIQQGYRITGETLVIGLRNFVRYALMSPHVIFVPFFLTGMVLAARRETDRPFWTSMVSLVLSGCVFSLLVPVDWGKYRLITVLPPASILIADGLYVFYMRITAERDDGRFWTPFAGAAFGLAWALWALIHLPVKPDLGYHRLVAAGLLHKHTHALVVGDARNEGALIAEASLEDPYLHRTILRSSKSLATMNWSGDAFREKYTTTQEVSDFLQSREISLVMIQTGYLRPDIQRLRLVVENNAFWKAERAGNVEIYRLNSAASEIP